MERNERGEYGLPETITNPHYNRPVGQTRVEIDPAEIERQLPRLSPWRKTKLGWIVRKLMALQAWGDRVRMERLNRS